MITDSQIEQSILNSKSMSEACDKLGMSFTTFKRRAIQLGLYNPNQGLKGTSKHFATKYELEDILNGKYPNYQSRKLKIRLIDNGLLEDKCCKCGYDKKRENNTYSICELHHKDGNPKNHLLNNLEILCPNCHALTENFRFNKRN